MDNIIISCKGVVFSSQPNRAGPDKHLWHLQSHLMQEWMQNVLTTLKTKARCQWVFYPVWNGYYSICKKCSFHDHNILYYSHTCVLHCVYCILPEISLPFSSKTAAQGECVLDCPYVRGIIRCPTCCLTAHLSLMKLLLYHLNTNGHLH